MWGGSRLQCRPLHWSMRGRLQFTQPLPQCIPVHRIPAPQCGPDILVRALVAVKRNLGRAAPASSSLLALPLIAALFEVFEILERELQERQFVH
jgi:hypothetical protein